MLNTTYTNCPNSASEYSEPRKSPRGISDRVWNEWLATWHELASPTEKWLQGVRFSEGGQP